MFKYLLVVCVFSCQCREYASKQSEGDTLVENPFEDHASAQSDRALSLLSENSTTLDSSEIAGEMRRKPEIAKNGRTGYRADEVGRQVFYVLGEQELERLLSAVRRDSDNINNNKTLLPQGYVVTPGIGAHKLHLRSMTWKKARQACVREGGHLAIINLESEEELLLQMLQAKGVFSAWVGFLFENGDWITVNGDTIESAGYTKWVTAYSTEPNYCGILRKEYGVHDGPCKFAHSFFCEIPV